MARESKHTPGKWTSTKATITYTQFNITAKDAFIGEVGGGLQSDDEIEANARLIAEAPTMYEMLKELADNPSFTAHLPTTRLKVLELIKKIEG